MSTPQINISSLDFQSIKNSLKSYLQTKSEFSGYNFNGSGLNALLDVFAYNTLYYAFYSNMIANETYLDTAQLERNIVSLVKPLGYLVPSKTCSKTEIVTTTKTGVASYTFAAYTDYFSAISSDNNVYRFYAIEDYSVLSGVNSDLVLYEASSVVKDLPVSVDTVNQKAFLANTGVDITTLKVKVNGEEWALYNTYQAAANPDGKVYFIDRLSNGFYLIFGKRTINDYQTSLGKNIESTDVVTVSYLIPSGSSSNGISSFSNTNLSVLSNTQSNNGADGPDIDLIKFFAPKLLAANDRAVTRDDYYGLLLASNLLPAGINSAEKINIWGGEDGDPATYGRVFISYADSSLASTNSTIRKNIQYLKSKSIVTVTPEYIRSQIVNVTLNVVVRGIPSSQSSALQTSLNGLYNNNYVFNNTINSVDIKDALFQTYPSLGSLDITNAFITLNIIGSDTEKLLYFKNSLKLPTANTVGRTIQSNILNYKGTPIYLTDVRTTQTTGEIVAVNNAGLRITSIPKLGTIDYSKGIVYLNSDVVSEGSTLNVYGYVANPNNIIMKDEFIPNVNSNVLTI